MPNSEQALWTANAAGNWTAGIVALGPPLPIGSQLVQNNSAFGNPLATIQISYNQVQFAGDLNVVTVSHNGVIGIKSVVDVAGNTYQLASGPTSYGVQLSESVYFASNIKAAIAGTNVVTVTFNSSESEVYVLISEYSVQNAAIDGTPAAITGASNNPSAGVYASAPNELVYASIAATTGPTMVQHMASGICNQGVLVVTFPIPNPALAGNTLIVGITFNSAGSVVITDDVGNSYSLVKTVTTTTYGRTASVYIAQNVIAGASVITATFSGLGGWATLHTNPSYISAAQAVITELYNVGAVDGTSVSSPTTSNPGTITTTVPGDLIYTYGVAASALVVSNGGTWEGTSLTAGTGATLLSADLQAGSCDQYQIAPSAGSVSPGFSANGHAGDQCCSIAFALKGNSSGTAPSPTAMRIVHLAHTNFCNSSQTSQAQPLQFPSTGNLLVLAYQTGGDFFLTGIADNSGNAWQLPSSCLDFYSPGSGIMQTAQICYVPNAKTSPNLSGITLIGAQYIYDNLILYDIANAAASPLATGNTNSNNVTGAGTSGTQLTTNVITPSQPNGVVIANICVGLTQISGLVGGTKYRFDSCFNTFENASYNDDTLDENQGFGHVYNPDTSQLTFVWQTVANGQRNYAGPYAAVAAA